MDLGVLAVLLVVGFVSLLLLGRAQVAKGANAAVANGATLLALSIIVGLAALAAFASLDIA